MVLRCPIRAAAWGGGGTLRGPAKAARDLAIVEARPAMLNVDAVGYQVSRRVRGEWRPGEHYDWQAGTVAVGGATRFDSTGLAQATTLIVSRGSGEARVEIRGDGTIHVQR